MKATAALETPKALPAALLRLRAARAVAGASSAQAAPAARSSQRAKLSLAARAMSISMPLLAVGATLLWAAAWPAGFSTDLGRVPLPAGSPAANFLAAAGMAGGPAAGPVTVALLPVVFGGLLALAVMFPLHLDKGHKLAMTDAVLFASLLLFGPPLAMAAMGLGSVAGYLVLLAAGRRSRWDLLFNSGKTTLAVGAGGLAYHVVGRAPAAAPFELTQAVQLLALPLAAAGTYFVNTFTVNLIIWLQHGKNPFKGWLAARRADALQAIGLYLIGLVTALTAQQNPWTVLVMALPTAPIYLTLKRTVRFLEQQLDQKAVAAVETMADAVDLRDPYTAQHCQRVAAYATHLAQHMGLPAEDVETIRLAARVHDLGKIGIPDHILRKPGALTSEERAQIDRHADMGADILARFADYRGCGELVRRHHERWDQRPDPATEGPAAERQRLGAQILAVADSLDAMTSNRPYRQALSLDEAMEEFQRHRGTQWHPLVVDALEALVREPAQERAIRRVRLAVMPA